MNEVGLMDWLRVLIPVALFAITTTWGVVGWLIKQLTSSLNQQLIRLDSDIKSESSKIAHIEKTFLELKAELPREYVRREDHIRYSAVIEAKQDALNEKISTLNVNVQRALDRTGEKK